MSVSPSLAYWPQARSALYGPASSTYRQHMNTQTHLLIAGALFARPGMPLRNTAVVIGALVPDLAIYTLFAWSKFAGIPEATVWRQLYWQEPWQTWTAAGNSIPLYLIALLLGVIFLRQASNTWRIGLVLTFVSLAALSHIAGDMPVHVDDAHRHFWPISDWKFISPISYWHPDHHGDAFGIFEAVLGFALAALLFVRFKVWWVRALLIVMMIAYVAVPFYFYWQMSGA